MAFLLVILTVVNCASAPDNDKEALTELKKINDPIEPTNRWIFKFNQGIDAVIIKPVTGVYRGVLPDLVRNSIHNFLNNIKTPVVLANDVSIK